MSTIVLVFALTSCVTSREACCSTVPKVGYVPIDALPVEVVPGLGCERKGQPDRDDIFRALSDISARTYTQKLDAKSNLSYAVGKVGAKGGVYEITVDYIHADTLMKPLWIAKTMWRQDHAVQSIPLDENSGKTLPHLTDGTPLAAGTENFRVTSTRPPPKGQEVGGAIYEYLAIPLYVGIGLRVSATVEVLDSTANISGLSSIGVEADASKLKGSLAVQTLGVTGKSVVAALPVQNELNVTTTQNAVVAVASIKTQLHSGETSITPRVVGMHLPFGGGAALANAIVRELGLSAIPWKVQCLDK